MLPTPDRACACATAVAATALAGASRPVAAGCLLHRSIAAIDGDGRAGPAVTRLDGLRIAMVNWRDPWQETAGGAEEYAWQMSRRLAARGARVHYVTSLRPGQLRRERREGVRLVRMGGTYSIYPLVFGWLLRHRADFDLVIDCMNGVPFFSPLAVSRSTRVLLLVHHVHGDQFAVYFRSFLARLGMALEGPVARVLYRRHRTVAISPSTAEAMRDRLRWAAPIYVVPNGTPTLRPVAGATATSGDPSLVCVGRLVTHKRVDLLVEAAAALRERWPELALHVVGRGPEHARLAGLVDDLGLRGTVFLHGYLPEATKNALLAGAHLHLSASEYEGWGLSVIEAASLGVPTVAHDVDGLREAVRDGETGWLAARGERLADTVERALNELSDPDRRASVQAACTRWAGNFSWDASAERLALLLRADPVPVSRGATGAYLAHYTETAGAGQVRSIIVENTDPDLLAARILRAVSERGGELRGIRPATRTELLTGRADSGP